MRTEGELECMFISLPKILYNKYKQCNGLYHYDAHACALIVPFLKVTFHCSSGSREGLGGGGGGGGGL